MSHYNRTRFDFAASEVFTPLIAISCIGLIINPFVLENITAQIPTMVTILIVYGVIASLLINSVVDNALSTQGLKFTNRYGTDLVRQKGNIAHLFGVVIMALAYTSYNYVPLVGVFGHLLGWLLMVYGFWILIVGYSRSYDRGITLLREYLSDSIHSNIFASYKDLRQVLRGTPRVYDSGRVLVCVCGQRNSALESSGKLSAAVVVVTDQNNLRVVCSIGDVPRQQTDYNLVALAAPNLRIYVTSPEFDELMFYVWVITRGN